MHSYGFTSVQMTKCI